MNLTHEQVLDLAAAYVLGALDPEEEQAVREHLASCELPHDELAEMGAVVPYLAETVEQVEPPAGLKDRIMAAAAADLEGRRPGIAAPGRDVVAFPSAAERDRRRRRSAAAWVLGIAAVLAIVALGVWNLNLQRDLDAARQQTAAIAVLSSEGGAASGIAVVAGDGTVRFAVRGLTPTTGTEVYEAWVIAGNNAPVPVGGFTVGSDGIGVLEAPGAGAAPGVTLALTKEPRPNPTAPTLPIVASGVATPPRQS